MRKQCGFIVLLIAFMMSYALPAKAELFADSYGLGGRPNAMGGAFTAVADDYMATYYNMAGLGQITEDQIGIEAMIYKPDVKVTNLSTGGALKQYNRGSVVWDPADDSEGNDMLFWSPVLGVAMSAKRIIDPLVGPVIRMFLPDLEVPNTTVGLVVGLTEFGNNALRVRALPPDEPHQINMGDQANQLVARVGAGMELIQDLIYVGGGVNIMVTVVDTTLFIPNYQGSTISTDKRYVALQGRLHVKLMYSPQFGLLLTPMDKKLKLGYAYNGESSVDTGELNVPVDLDMSGLFDMNLFFAGHFISSYTPTRHRFGISYNLFDTLLLSCDIVRKQWSDFEYGKAEENLFSENFRGTYNIPAGYIIPTSPGFKDTTDIHLGAEMKLGELLTARCGYISMPNPVPNQSNKLTNYIAYDTTVYTVGGSINWNNPKMEIIGAISYFQYDGYTVSKPYMAPDAGITWLGQTSYKVEDATAIMISGGLKWWF